MVNEVHELDDFTFTYIMTALWSTNDWGGGRWRAFEQEP